MKVSEYVAIGSDHAGFWLKEVVKNSLEKENILVRDFGTFSSESMDYPDIAHPVANAVDKGFFKKAILICGSGNGVAMVANKYLSVRAAICWNKEITILARKHNDANIIVLPGRFINHEEAIELVKIFLSTSFDGGRHEKRVKKIAKPGNLLCYE